MSFPADPTPNPPVSASADFSGPIRVILAGRVTLERTLRRDPEVELIRVQTPLRALGELAQPMDDASPRATVIVLAGGALPEGHEEAFVEAARSLDPDVRFVVSLDDPLGQAPPPLDLVVTTSTTVEQFRALLADRPAARPEPESVVSPETDAAPIPDPDPGAPTPNRDPRRREARSGDPHRTRRCQRRDGAASSPNR